MKIMGMGLDLKGKRIWNDIDERTFSKKLADSLSRVGEKMRPLTKTTSAASSFRGEVQMATLERWNPISAGWSYLVNSRDPKRADIQKAIAPLANHRGMGDPKKPLMFNNETEDDWFEWLNENYYALELEGKKAPEYILILGGPDQVPFRFQAVLDTIASVGRIDLDTIAELSRYVEKLLRLEKTPKPAESRKTVFFAPDGGLDDPTHYSLQYMAEPLAEHVKNDLHMPVQKVMGNEATKAGLLAALNSANPALVFTASHGLLAVNEALDIQKRFNGAICCQHDGPLTQDALFSAEDIPPNRPFLDGAVFFQFACFGGGTPAMSDFTHWLPGEGPTRYAANDFSAALPKKLLALSQGPRAFIGHLDTAFLHAFADPDAPDTIERFHFRLSPFMKAIDMLLGVLPSGLAMEEMNKRYGFCNAMITNTFDRERQGKLTWNDKNSKKFLDMWITRGDSQNYLIFGDPAACLRIPAP